MNIELKPCPFCGGEAEMMGDQYPYVECHECGAGFTANHSYEFDEDDAASNWNSRRFGQDKMKRIAEKKIEQLGGDVCGVLVRTEGGVMAVSEHGRCTRLDAGVMGPVDGAQDGEWLIQMRGDYLKTRGVWERPDHRGYTNDINDAGRYSEEEARKAEQMMPEKCKAVRLPTARAQSGQGAEPEPVFWWDGDLSDLDGCVMKGQSAYHNIPLYTQPQPAQQDPDLQLIRERDYWEGKATELAEDVGKLLGVEVGEHSSHNCPVQNAIDAVFRATEYPAQQGSVPDGFSEFVSAVRSINRSSHHAIQIPGDDQPCFWQRKEWIDWILELADQVEDSLSAATPQPQGDGWIPEGWKLVPVEPTTEMRYAYHEAYQRYLEGSIPSPDGQWWAMLDAAPQPPQEGE